MLRLIPCSGNPVAFDMALKYAFGSLLMPAHSALQTAKETLALSMHDLDELEPVVVAALADLIETYGKEWIKTNIEDLA